MKNPFNYYPAVFYQIAGVFFLSQFCFSFGLSFSYVDSFREVDYEPPFSSLYISLIISTLYIVSGLIVNKIKDFTLGIKIGTSLLLVGTLIAQWGGNSELPYFFSTTLLNIGVGINLIFCIYHTAILFPIANDWKDNAFMMLLLGSPIFTTIFFQVQTLILKSFIENMDYESYFLLIKILNLIFIGILFYQIYNLKNLGFKIEEETSDKKEIQNPDENSFIKKVMIGVILLSFIFFFITSNLAKLDLFKRDNVVLDSSLESLIDAFGGSQGYFFLDSLPLVLLAIIGIMLMYFAQNRSTQFYKIKIICYALFVLVILKTITQLEGASAAITLIEYFIPYLFTALILPFLISIMTHVNLDKNLGIWLGVLFAIPEIFRELQYQFEYAELGLLFPNFLKYLPYVAIVLLILFLIVLRENREFLEKKLELNESNQASDDDDVDILEHFVE